MKNYHKIIQDGIILFGKSKKEEILNISKRKLLIYHPSPNKRNITPIEYHPDVTFTVSDRRKYTFQVLGSQIKHKREIEADIFRAFLSPEVSKLIFIASNKKDIEMVDNITTIIEENLLDYGIKRKALPITIFIKIPSRIKKAEDVVRFLKSYDKNSKLFL
jgi:hypothetical protein